MAETLFRRLLGPADEEQLRALWAPEPEANLFSIPDLDFLGWQDSRLRYVGWFEGKRLIGYLMLYGISAQWSFIDERPAAEIASFLKGERIQFITGMERYAWPVLSRLPQGTMTRHELSTVAYLPSDRFNAATLQNARGRTRLATMADLERLTAVHVAAPDQFNQLDYGARRMALYAVLNDRWRRLFLSETPDGRIAASAQSTAEGDVMAVIGGVVTHPDLRGQGYATLATAHLSAALLDQGKAPYLFYRRDNAPAARVYQKIGYIPLGDAILAELEW